MNTSKLSILPFLALSLAFGQEPGHARKRLLAIGEEKGYRHEAVSHALATIERLGRESGLWDTTIRTDTEVLTKKKLEYNAPNLNDFDAVLFYTGGNLEMDDRQKADFLSFIHDDGKGFIGIHSATITFTNWPEYGEMIGGYYDEHPWGTFNAPILVEDPAFPGMRQWPAAFVLRDEIYQLKNYSSDKVPVLMGAWGSSLTLAVMPKLMEYETAMVVETSSSGKITTTGNPYIFRISPPSAVEAAAFKGIVDKLDLKKVDFLVINNDWGRGTAEDFSKMMKEKGITVGLVETMDQGAQDMSAQLSKLKGTDSETIIVTTAVDQLTLIFKQAAALGLKKRIITTGGSQSFGDTVDLTAVGSGLIDSKKLFAQSDKAGRN